MLRWNFGKRIENTCVAWELVEHVTTTYVLRGNLLETKGQLMFFVRPYGKRTENTGFYLERIENK